MKTKLSCLAAAIVASAGLLPLTAHADESWFTVRNVQVPYGDLNLAAEQDARELLSRIRTASMKACRRDGDKGIAKEASLCRRDAVAQAVRQVKAPVLTALYEGRDSTVVLASR